MIVYPCCKINLGLYVTGKRPDGYHDLETAFYPVGWCDAVEVISHPEKKPFELRCSGPVSPGQGKNIIEKAWELLAGEYRLPPLMAVLYKNIPTGAGLGGGSADAAFFIRLVSEFCGLNTDKKKLHALALELGSDCPFFIDAEPVLASGRGEIFRRLDLSLDEFYILIVHPGIHISTAAAFGMIRPAKPATELSAALEERPETWRHTVKNDFEPVAIKMHPALADIKERLYTAGALYASMSGSGSSFYGIFEKKPQVVFDAAYRTFLREPVSGIL